MKPFFFFLLIGASLSSQESPPVEAPVQAAKTAQYNEWQNWAFAGGSAIAATAALFLVTINSGEAPGSHAH